MQQYFETISVLLNFVYLLCFQMFFVDLPEKEDVEDEDEDEIDKSIKEIHQSAQKLSDSIVHVAGNNKTLADNDDKLNAISATFKGKLILFYFNST